MTLKYYIMMTSPGSSVLSSSVQTNTSEEEGRFRSEAVLSYSFSQADLAARLQCVVQHPAYSLGRETIHANLDVLCKSRITVEICTLVYSLSSKHRE